MGIGLIIVSVFADNESVTDSKLTILILEDDIALAGAYKEALEAASYAVTLANRPDDASKALAKTSFDYVLIDCFLPQIPGVDFYKQEAAKMESSKIVFMSGIFTDRLFIKDAVESAAAIGFLKKPFEIQELLDVLDKNRTAVIVSGGGNQYHLHDVFFEDFVSKPRKEKVRFVENLEKINGLDIPILVMLMQDIKFSGQLNLISDSEQKSSVTFSEGTLAGVVAAGDKTKVGELLVQNGWAFAEDIKWALEDKTSSKMLGEKLTENFLVSPHGFDLTLIEQIKIRLSMLIADRQYLISLTRDEEANAIAEINRDRQFQFIHDLVAANLSIEWLQHQLRPYLLKYASVGEWTDEVELLFGSALVYQSGISRASFSQPVLLLNLLKERKLFKPVFYLLLTGAIVLHRESVLPAGVWKEWVQFLTQELSKVATDDKWKFVHHPNPNLKLKLIENVRIALANLNAKALPPDYLQIVVSCFETGVSGIKSPMNAKSNEVEKRLQASQLVESAKLMIQKFQYQKALTQLQMAADLDSGTSQLHLYLAWARVYTGDRAKRAQIIKEVEMELLQVPPAEKMSVQFSFVQALFHKLKGEIMLAKRALEKCIQIEVTFLPAKRELALIEAELGARNDILKGDFKNVVSGFFKGRK